MEVQSSNRTNARARGHGVDGAGIGGEVLDRGAFG
jgi:hypothetical protein